MKAINLGAGGILHLPDMKVPLGSGRAAARVDDQARVLADAHGCPACPHPAAGPIVTGSPNVFVNGRRAARVEDTGTHTACCGPNTFEVVMGSATVYINGKPGHRKGDETKHCGGIGSTYQGSGSVQYGGASVRKGDPQSRPQMTNWMPNSGR